MTEEERPPHPTSRYLLNDHPMLVMPDVAVALGLNEAVIVQQILYWMKKSEHLVDGRYWVYNTLAEWHDHFPWCSAVTLKRALAGLRKQGVLLVANFNENPFDRMLWYSIDHEVLDAVCDAAAAAREAAHSSIGSKRSNGGDHSPIGSKRSNLIGSKRSNVQGINLIQSSLTETTTETTTERGHERGAGAPAPSAALGRQTKRKTTIDDAFLEALVADFAPRLGEDTVRRKLQKAQNSGGFRGAPDKQQYLVTWLEEDAANAAERRTPSDGRRAASGGAATADGRNPYEPRADGTYEPGYEPFDNRATWLAEIAERRRLAAAAEGGSGAAPPPGGG